MAVISGYRGNIASRRDIDPLASIPFRITVELRAGGPVIALRGELDVATAPIAETAFLDIWHLHGFSNAVVDLTQLSFCDCTGLNLLLHLHRHALAGAGWVRLVGAEPRLRRMLEITGLASTLVCYPTPSDAFADVGPITSIASTFDERAIARS